MVANMMVVTPVAGYGIDAIPSCGLFLPASPGGNQVAGGEVVESDGVRDLVLGLPDGFDGTGEEARSSTDWLGS
ncbi:hypothetical protein [Aestuariimicrobium sp. T2.26MG-19.2B]|uniref:hypothetical protein n=1 Tax=Aestuariimicrobium sp. T2.26MG-19.2B TaxID=3040679 RepID=UPI00253FC56E|nr:hypothetical protein [Aestuariimicrobium sp. T2.26MG-19.2B]